MFRGSLIDGEPRVVLERFALGAVGALAGLRARDDDVRPADARRAVAHVPGERVLEESRVVALGGARVEALVRAARLAPLERRMRHRLRDIELEAELDRAEPFRVPGGRAVAEAHALATLLEHRELEACRLHP